MPNSLESVDVLVLKFVDLYWLLSNFSETHFT